jgi:hypothetical protein
LDDKLFSGDVVRKLLVQLEQQADLSQPTRRPPQEPSVAVKVRERASRRAVKYSVNTAEAEARAHHVAASVGGLVQPTAWGIDVAVRPSG